MIVFILSHAGSLGANRSLWMSESEAFERKYRSSTYLEDRILYFMNNHFKLRFFTNLTEALQCATNNLEAVFQINVPELDLSTSSTGEISPELVPFSSKCKISDIQRIYFFKSFLPEHEEVAMMTQMPTEASAKSQQVAADIRIHSCTEEVELPFHLPVPVDAQSPIHGSSPHFWRRGRDIQGKTGEDVVRLCDSSKPEKGKKVITPGATPYGLAR